MSPLKKKKFEETRPVFMLNRWIVIYDPDLFINSRNPIKRLYGVIKGAYLVSSFIYP